MTTPTRQDWRKFHYGSEAQKAKITDWILCSPSGNTYGRGNYAYCAMIRKQMEAVNPQLKLAKYRLKIVPSEKFYKPLA